MADVANRDAKEGWIAQEVSREFTRFRMELLGTIVKLDEGDKDVPGELWEKHAERLSKDVEPVLKRIYWLQAQTMVRDGG